MDLNVQKRKRKVAHSIYLWATFIGMDVVDNGSRCMLLRPFHGRWEINVCDDVIYCKYLFSVAKMRKKWQFFSLLREEAQPSEIREMATFFGKRWLLSSQEKSKWVFIEAAVEYICHISVRVWRCCRIYKKRPTQLLESLDGLSGIIFWVTQQQE